MSEREGKTGFAGTLSFNGQVVFDFDGQIIAMNGESWEVWQDKLAKANANQAARVERKANEHG